MVRVKSPRKAKKKQRLRVKAPRMKAPRGRLLDKAALDYATLLADPCNAQIVHPIFPGGDAGFLFRAESFVTLGNGATDTSGFLHWTPGYVNGSSTELLYAVGAFGNTAVTAAALASAPGKGFLTNNARGVRCVAACVKVTFAGSESARSGRVHYGLTQSGMLDAGTTQAPDGVAQALQHYGRTPADTFELIWKPNIGDTEFNDPTEAASAVLKDRKSALTVSWAGLPAAVGLTFHFTAVYEWTPASTMGIGHNALGKARSKNTLDEILDTLIGAGFSFVRNAATVAGTAFGAEMSKRISNVYGLMPAVPHTRQLSFY